MDLLAEHLAEVHLPEEERLGLLFRYVQYIERQVVLVDALRMRGMTA